MRKYYIVMVEMPPFYTEPKKRYEIKLTDSSRYKNVLAEIEAPSYSEALKMVTFSKTQNGETKFL